jgi:hypothetical protein
VFFRTFVNALCRTVDSGPPRGFQENSSPIERSDSPLRCQEQQKLASMTQNYAKHRLLTRRKRMRRGP